MLQVEIYIAMMGIAHAAKLDRVPGSLRQVMLSAAVFITSLDEKSAVRFAKMVLKGPTSLREACGRFPERTAEACLRLVRLLEYVAGHGEDQPSPDSKAV